MDEVRSQTRTRKRTVLRRIVPERLADFDEQVWPVNLAILVFAGFVTGVVLATVEDFFDPRPLYNGFVRLGVIAVLVGVLLWTTSRVRAPTARRIQFCVILSLLLHMVLAVFLREQYLKLIAYIKEKQGAVLADVETSLSLPDYPEESVENPGALKEYTRPVPEVTSLESPLPEGPAPRFDSAANVSALVPRAEERPLLRDEPQPMAPPRITTDGEKRSQRPVNREERQPTPARQELATLAPLETPPRQLASSRETRPRDTLQPQESLPTQLPRADTSENQPEVAADAPPRVTVEPPIRPGQSPAVPRQPTPARQLLPNPLEEQLIAPASPARSERDLQPEQALPRRTVAGLALPAASIAEQPLRPDPRVLETSAFGRLARRETAPTVQAALPRKQPTGSTPSHLAASAEVAPVPTAMGPKFAPQPEKPVAVGGPESTPIFPTSSSPRSDLAEPMDLAPHSLSATARVPRSAETIDSKFVGVGTASPPGVNALRSAESGPMTGSVVSIPPIEPVPSGSGAGSPIGMERYLEPRSEIGAAMAGEIRGESAGQIGQSGGEESAAASVSELTQAIGTGFPPTSGGRGDGIREGELLAEIGARHGIGATPGRATPAPAGSLASGPVPLETGSASDRGTGPPGGIPGERPGSADLAYGSTGSAEVGIPPGPGESQQGMSAAAAGSFGGSVATGEGNAGIPGDLFTDARGSLGKGITNAQFPGTGQVFRDRELYADVSSGGSFGGMPAARQGRGTRGIIPSAVPLEPGVLGEVGGDRGAGSSPSGVPGDRSTLEPAYVAGSLPLLPLGDSGGEGESGLSATGQLLPPRVHGGGTEARLEIGQIGSVKTARRATTGTASPQVLVGRADLRPSEAFSQRSPAQRSAQVAQFGGSPETEQAVERGLAFLARIQFPDGHWSFHRLPDQVPDPQKSFHLGTMHGDTAATALSLLAFLGAGYTHQEEKYRDTVNRALRWLIQNQLSDGRFFREGTDSDLYTQFYGHGLATIALCEAYGMTRDPALRQPAERGIAFIVRSQSPEFGGWRYVPRKETDTSVTGWQLMALKSAQMAGLEVPQATLERVTHWLDRAQAEGGAKYVYSPYAGADSAAAHLKTPNRAMTAEGLLMRIYLGWGPNHPALQAGTAFLAQNLPSYGNPQNPLRDAYYWYYATQVMFQMQGEAWKIWNERIQETLLPEQVQTGPWAGSWDPLRSVPDRWGKEAGRLYVTAMHLLILEVYYRHLPLFRSLAQSP